MCSTCGCGTDNDAVKIMRHGDVKPELHTHEHDHAHTHEHVDNREEEYGLIELERDILYKNDMIASRNRGYFDAKNILALNLVSSPGSGKTTILEKTITSLSDEIDFYVIEGDQQTTNDAERISATGAPVVQVNTGKGCHLESEMVHQSIHKLEPTDHSILMIENVGNLVCPSLFDLGENFRVVIISVTEGDDKPLKYPNMFASSQVCLINKIDLLPYVDFDVEKVKEYARRINHHLQFFELSATTGEGLDQWCDWLKENQLVKDLA